MIERFSALRDTRSIAFMQEFNIFSALAPKKIIDAFEAKSVSFPEYYKLLCLFSYYDFKELLIFHRRNPNHSLDEEDKRIFESGTDEEIEQLILKHNWDFDDSEYISLFNENIKSEGLKNTFCPKAS